MISFLKQNSRLCFGLVLMAGVVALLTSQGVTVGDDLGYLFSDAQLHAGGGARIGSFTDVMSTQISHFLTFNGRIIVHSLTQILLMEGMHIVYALLNGIVFCGLWMGISRLCSRDGHIHVRSAFFCLFLIWWLMPVPGVIWLSLVAFSMNYLWPAAVAAWLLVGISHILNGQRVSLVLWLPLAFIVGAMQESFALPLLGGIGITWLVLRSRRLLHVGIALLAGAVALLAAPGNYAHAAAGGGFAPDVLMHKTIFMARDLFRTPLPWLGLLYVVMSLRRSTRKLLRPDNLELLLLITIGCSLLLGVLSYTALRQLVAPSLFATVLIARLCMRLGQNLSPRQRGVISGACVTLTALLLAGGFILRAETATRVSEVEEAVARGESVLWIDCAGAGYNNPLCRVLLWRMDDDPFADDLLHIVYDSNTRKGLWRRFAPSDAGKRTPEILPVTRDSLAKAGRRLALRGTVGTYPSMPLDSRYSLLITANADTLPDLRFTDDTHMQFASVRMNDTLYLIVPSRAKAVKIKTIH